jgi:hypothetical protein
MKLAILRRIKKYLPMCVRQTFYNYYILPVMEYCSIVWASSGTNFQNELLKLQKQAARLILDRPVIGSNSKEMFSILKWLPIQYRIRYHLAITAFKAINKLLPTNICNFLTLAQNTNNHNLRSSTHNNFYMERRHPKSVITKIIKVWNELPPKLKVLRSLGTFKYQLKIYLRSLQ